MATPATSSPASSRLPWARIGNRPFLRACHALGLAQLHRCEWSVAATTLEVILRLNPMDNPGVRALAVEHCFRLGEPHAVLNLCDRYPGDRMPELLYGRALALHPVGRRRPAAVALRQALRYLPLVGKGLTRKRHPRAAGLSESYAAFAAPDRPIGTGVTSATWGNKRPGPSSWWRSSCASARRSA